MYFGVGGSGAMARIPEAPVEMAPRLGLYDNQD